MDSDSDEAEKLQSPDAEEVGNSCCLCGCSIQPYNCCAQASCFSITIKIC